ncbi:hypothetical protein [Alloscardovia criceti]|uniref:hypothetical protein n=1 Tax=Alloscardovia criceti TaxID=356828 RepID=UPI001FDF44ED|nr:hypothetical protein [Alloscardovia criceti]
MAALDVRGEGVGGGCALGLASGEFGLDDVPRVGVDDRLMAGGDVVLGYFPSLDLVRLARKSTVKVCCSRASPLYSRWSGSTEWSWWTTRACPWCGHALKRERLGDRLG